MTVLDLLRLCSYQEIENVLKRHYSDVNTEEFSKLYSSLCEMTDKNTITEELYLCIIVRKIQDDGSELVADVFEENDKDIYFDVSGYEKGDEILHSIVALTYEEFLQYHIDKDTLEKFTPASILAHSLWEITSFGFEDEKSL